MNNTLLLKIKVGKEMRRTSIPFPRSFDDLTTSLKGFLEKPFQKIEYEDDEGDNVVIANTSDLTEALRQLPADKPILRLTVTKEREHSERRCPRFRGVASSPVSPSCGGAFAGPFAEIINSLKAQVPAILADPNIRAHAEQLLGKDYLKIVTNYICDHCNGQICGDRYNSVTKPDFDLCSACFASVGERLEAEYKFKKISAMDALIECLQNGGNVEAQFAPGMAAPPVSANKHHAICDSCNAGIVGTRHKCLDCADYDECSICRVKSVHAADHVFHEIKDVSVRRVPDEVMAAHRAQKEEKAKHAELERLEAKAAKAKEAAEEANRLAKAAADEAQKVADESRKIVSKPVELVKPVEKELPKEVPKPVAPPAEDPKPSSFEQNLATLEAMGFSDRRRNIQILVRNRNQLFSAIQEILSSQ